MWPSRLEVDVLERSESFTLSLRRTAAELDAVSRCLNVPNVLSHSEKNRKNIVSDRLAIG